MNELSNILQSSQNILQSQNVWWKQTLFSIQNKPYDIVDLGLILIALIFGLWLAVAFKRFMVSNRAEKFLHDKSIRYILGNFGKYLISIFTIFIIMESLGISLSSLTILAGALSVGLGFGLKNIVNNFVSGIIVMSERSIKLGDIIEVNGYVGAVSEIRLRSTIVTTFDKVEIVIPNGILVESSVVNRTLTNPYKRLVVPFGVAYGTDVNKLRSLILNALESSDLKHVKQEPYKPFVKVANLAASSLDMELYVHVNQQDCAPFVGDFVELVYNELNKANIEIPFAKLDVKLVDAKA